MRRSCASSASCTFRCTALPPATRRAITPMWTLPYVSRGDRQRVCDPRTSRSDQASPQRASAGARRRRTGAHASQSAEGCHRSGKLPCLLAGRSTEFSDIIRNIDAIASYTAGMNQNAFLSDSKTCDATERCLSRVQRGGKQNWIARGRACTQSALERHRGIGNWLRHEYPGVLGEIVWKIVTEDLASLRRDCEKAIAELLRRRS